MKRFILFLHIMILPGMLDAQHKLLKRSWINTHTEEFMRNDTPSDTSYLRYEFGNFYINVGFDPAWNFLQLPYFAKDNVLTINNEPWVIEHLSDTALVIYMKGFRRMRFVEETHLSNSAGYLQPAGEYNGKPLYKANRYITPRYGKANALRDDICKEDIGEDYNIRKARTFLISFIITEEGKVVSPQVLKGIATGYDKKVIQNLSKTSKYWQPAMHSGKPVQTLMYFEVKFLDSLIQY